MSACARACACVCVHLCVEAFVRARVGGRDRVRAYVRERASNFVVFFTFCASQGLDSQAKNLVTLGNLLLLPLVLLFLNSLPWQQSFEAAKFYISNNCQANGGGMNACWRQQPQTLSHAVLYIIYMEEGECIYVSALLAFKYPVVDLAAWRAASASASL